MLRSIVEYYAEHEGYRCGYCKKPDTSYSHGMWAHVLTVQDYQDLIDRGWRRSGKYCYKPTMDLTCCPMYTIRCRALEFKASKSQKKVLKRFNKFLMGEDIAKPSEVNRKMSTCSSSTEEIGGVFDDAVEEFVENRKKHQEIDIKGAEQAIDMIESNVMIDQLSKGEPSDGPFFKNNHELKTESTTEKANSRECGPDPNKPLCKKAKQLRREKRLEKLKERGIDVTTLAAVNSCKNKEKQIGDFINDLGDVKHKLEVKLVRTNPPSQEYLATAKETHALYVKYQTVIHNDKPDKCTESKFKEFLVNSPLLEEYLPNGPPCGFGSFHQQYWVDGTLVAVGVVDILPTCLSSVYFFYDPRYMGLTWGTYGALREIDYTRHLHSICPEIQYYYMGFYIHSCRKMRYKGNFFPSDLACPETYKWFLLQDCLPKLDASPFSRLDPDIDSIDANFPQNLDLNYIPVWVRGSVMLYRIYKTKVLGKTKDETDELMQYSSLVGGKSARSLVLVRC